MHSETGATPNEARIDSWKSIAAFFGRDERTVKRWEKTRALPVHRLPGEKGGVFAYRHELILWLHSATSETRSENEPAQPAEATDAVPLADLALPSLDSAQPAADSILQPGESVPANAGQLTRAHVPLVRLVAPAAVLLLLAALGWYLIRKPHMPSAAAAPVTATSAVAGPAAHEAYMMGRYYWNHRTGGSLRKALEAFTDAVVKDPGYAPAYAGLADCYNLMPEYTDMQKSQAFPLALAAARKAVALDDSLSQAHRALAFALYYWEWDVNGAFREYKRAIQLDPNDVDAHQWYANSLATSGELKAAEIEIEKAQALDPTSRAILASQAMIRFSAGDRQESIDRLKELEESDPDFLSPPRYLAQFFFSERDFPQYIAQLNRAAALSKDLADADLAKAAEQGWKQGGEHAMLEHMRAVQLEQLSQGKASGYDLALTCALLGDKNAADRYLQAAFDARDFMVMTAVRGDFNDSMKGNPGFERLKVEIEHRLQRSPVEKP